MTKSVRKFRPQNKIRALAFSGKGLLAKDAIANAQAGMESLREMATESIREIIAEIERLFGPSAADRANTDPMDLYELTARIIDVSSCLPEACLDQAAKSLCDLVDQCAEADAWNWPAVDVHVATLQLLSSQQALTHPERQKILSGLAAVNERLARR